MIPRDPKPMLVGTECVITQPFNKPPNVIAGQFKGSLCFVKDYNPFTDVATVLIEKNNTQKQVSGDCLSPR